MSGVSDRRQYVVCGTYETLMHTSVLGRILGRPRNFMAREDEPP